MGLYTLRNHFWKPLLSVSKPSKSNSLWIIMLLLSGDVEVNPGPETKWSCGICQYPVIWSQEGVACDGCELWHHKSSISLCSDDFQLLERSNIAWKCCKCDSINCDTFTFHSFELQASNSFYPLTFESTIDSIHHKYSALCIQVARDQELVVMCLQEYNVRPETNPPTRNPVTVLMIYQKS